MTEVTAGQSALTASSDRLSEVFAEHHEHLQHFVLRQLRRPDWHLAEDLTSETFLRLVRDYTGREISGRVFSLLATIARHAIADHYRLRRSGESAADFADVVQERNLPAEFAAEDYAIANLTAFAMLADSPAPLGVAA